MLVDPIEALREQLAEHKQAGEHFDTAWSKTIAALVAPRSNTTARIEHNHTIAALDATRGAWERALPRPAEHPLVRATSLSIR